MRRSLILLVLLAGVCTFVGTGAAASPPDQIVFSKTGAFDPSLGPFGFWIWCTPPGGSYGDCAGSMYFYSFSTLPPNGTGGSPTEPVEGTVTELGSGAYQMHVWTAGSGTFGFPIDCWLTGPVIPTAGPTNKITVRCSEPRSGSATVDGAVVKVVEH
jgi:hypothetical protein